MATIGQQLLQPEAGWRRYDDTDSRIKYICANIRTGIKTGYWQGKSAYLEPSGEIYFKFVSDKIRLITGAFWSTGAIVNIYIDNIDMGSVNLAQFGDRNWITSQLMFEKLDLQYKEHTINIKFNSTEAKGLYFDAIDIDSNGYLVHPILNQVSTPENMKVGDCIPCRYTALTSGTSGTFSELGTCKTDEIPVIGTATPDGLFYFVKVDKGKLIADRVLQHSISWDALNSAMYIEGTKFHLNEISTMTGNTTPSGIASCSPNPYKDPFNAFDKNPLKTSWQSDNAAKLPQWVAYEFPTSKLITAYSLNMRWVGIYSPASWTLQASNDDTNWAVLDTQTNITGWTVGVKKQFDIASPNLYKKYKLVITANTGGSPYVDIGEIELLNDFNGLIRSLLGGCAYADYVVKNSIMTSNISPKIISASSEFSNSYFAYMAFNGIKSGENCWATLNVLPPHWLIYDNINLLNIDGYTITSYDHSTLRGYGIKTWKFQGSNNGTDWVDLDYQSNIAFGQKETKVFKIPPCSYSKYRLYITDVATPGTRIAIEELELIESSSISSITDKGLGAWPITNEWDKYIVNSDLGGKITKGDDNVWHWKNLYCWTKDTSIKNNTYRTVLGYSNYNYHQFDSISSAVVTTCGFRPILEYIEPDGSSKQTNLWY